MEYNYEHERIEGWFSEGVMTRDAVLQAMGNTVLTPNHIFTEQELSVLENKFKSTAHGDVEIEPITEEMFLGAFSKGNAKPPPSFAGAGYIIYRSIYHISAFPFAPTGPMDFEAFVRGLAWLLPSRAEDLSSTSNYSRARSAADQRRLLFQSLATSLDGKNTPFDAQTAREAACRRARDFSGMRAGGILGEFAATNFDDDGDEMFHDVLDILYSYHPLVDTPPHAPFHRDAFRPLAKRLHKDRDVKLHHLSIPQQDMESLVEFLLEYRWAPADQSPAAAVAVDWKSSSTSITKSFAQGKDSGITWPEFDHAYTSITPYLFQPLLSLLSTHLLGHTDDRNSQASLAPFSSPSRLPEEEEGRILLTPPVLSQLAAIFVETISVEDMKLLKSFKLHGSTTTPNHHSVADVTSFRPSDFDDNTEGAMILFSGTNTSTSSPVLFACYTSKPWGDAIGIEERDEERWEHCSLLQLSPIQDVFRGIVGQPAWKISGDDDELQFGNPEKGVGLKITGGLRHAWLTHVPQESAQQEQQQEVVFKASDWRGRFSIHVKIESIEVWGN
ncbi:hypothetical protein DM02DRAFT_704654 [Periconia macrospinosa]|uniref:TLDc domain-containing protein n=1 Tax=Periconia macrospinosa TaxID=97972 RepID=A0A2V1DWA1_9PLEO|nr:hypothetical protein DM02DRAFT_704654 [Periconia macrospinosa]